MDSALTWYIFKRKTFKIELTVMVVFFIKNAPGTPISLSQSKVTLNEDSSDVKEVIVVIQFSKYAGLPSFPCNPFATKTYQTQ